MAGVLAAGLTVALLSGCGSDDSGKQNEAKPSPSAEGKDGDDGDDQDDDEDEDAEGDDDRTGELPDSYDFEADPDRIPQNAEQAQQLTRNAQLTADSWASGMVPHDPYETTGSWAVLPDDCVWQRGELPEHILDTLTRRLDIPAADGKGLIQATAKITVHRTVEDAEQEIADTLDESFRCPDQDLGGGQQLTGLMSLEMPQEEVLNADASVFEAGQYTAAGAAESYDFVWSKSRIGMVTAAVSVKGAEGYEVTELIEIAALGAAQVLYNIELELS
jgi:hypothetical protein